MARFLEWDDRAAGSLLDQTIAVVGYGNQGTAHAQNLRDSGFQVVVGARPGSARSAAAKADGFEVGSASWAAARADIVSLCLPDQTMSGVFQQEIESNLVPGKALVFVHGFNIRFALIKPPAGIDVVLVAPKGPGAGLRSEFLAGRGLAGMIGVSQDSTGVALKTACGYAWGLGCFRSVVFETTFAEETDCDLFGEQAVLCGGMIELIKAGFETLVSAGYSPEAAYFECLHETKLIVDLLVSRGLEGMRAAISDTAEWGGYEAGKAIVGKPVREAMSQVLKRIQSGEFAQRWIAEASSGAELLHELRSQESNHPIEHVGSELRRRMGLLHPHSPS